MTGLVWQSAEYRLPRGSFLKEFVKRKMVFLRVLRSRSAGRSGRLFLVVGVLADNSFPSFWIRLGCRRRGKLQSFFADAIAPETFLRVVPLTIAASSSAWHGQTDADLSGANSSP